jgi:hypothetical protein
MIGALKQLAPPHTATHKLGHQLMNFRSCASLVALTTWSRRLSGHCNTDAAVRTGVLVRRLRCRLTPGEARFGYRLVLPHLRNGDKILEIGSGLGMLSGFFLVCAVS